MQIRYSTVHYVVNPKAQRTLRIDLKTNKSEITVCGLSNAELKERTMNGEKEEIDLLIETAVMVEDM